MKKLAKYLLLFLALAVLTSALAFTVLADGEAQDSSTPWTPVDNPLTDYNEADLIYYGYWASEESYLAGDAPICTNLDDTTTVTDPNSEKYVAAYVDEASGKPIVLNGYWVRNKKMNGYIRLFRNTTYVSTYDNYLMKDNAKNVFDLAGHTLKAETMIYTYPNHTYAATAHFKNGTIVTDQQIRTNRKGTLIFENVNLNANYIGYVSGGTFKFINSVVTLTNGRPFFFGANLAATDASVTFIGTSLICTSSKIAKDTNMVIDTSGNPNSAIFNIFANETPTADLNYDWTIFFDKNSSIQTPNVTGTANLLGIYQTADLYYDNSLATHDGIEFYFEEGCSFNGSARPDLCYFTNNRNGSASYAKYSSDDKCEIAMVNVSEVEGEVVYTPVDDAHVQFIDLTDGWYFSSSKSLSELAANGPKWTPAEGSDVTYATWKNEIYYLVGKAPNETYTVGEIVTSQVRALTNQYIRLFNDITLKSDGNTQLLVKNQTLVIDFNGKAITFTCMFYLYDKVPCNLTMKNGELNLGDNQFQYRAGSNIVMEKLTLNCNQFGYSSRGNLKATGCTFNIAYNIYLSNNNKDGVTVEFYDCDFKFTRTSTPGSGNKSNYYFSDPAQFETIDGSYRNRNVPIYVNISSGSDYGAFNLSFDKDCTFSAPKVTQKVYLVSVTELATGACTQHPANITFEDGVTFDNYIVPDFGYATLTAGETSYKYVKADGTVSLVDAGGNDAAYWYATDAGNGNYRLHASAAMPTVGEGMFTANLTLYTDFVMNFFADTSVIGGLVANGNVVEAGKYQNKAKYEIPVSVTKAADDIFLLVGINVGEEVHYYPATYSVLAYSNQIVGGTFNDDAKQLVSAAMAYVSEAYKVAGKAEFEFNGVALPTVDNTAVAVDSINAAISGAQLDLNSGFKLRFNLDSDYSGDLYVADAKYEVVDGKVGTLTYVEVELRAYQLADAVAISLDNQTVVYYGVANYAKAVNNDLVNALYTYCAIAKTYRQNNY